MTKKRDIFAELTEGFEALQQQREGKLTLRTFKVQSRSAHPGKPGTRPRQAKRQDALLIRMVAQFPDMVQRLESV